MLRTRIAEHLKRSRDRCWEIYRRHYEGTGYLNHTARYRQAIAASVTPASVVLDAGCGADLPFTREIAPQVRAAVGVDVVPLDGERGRALGCRADLHRLPFRDGVFDLVISMSVVEHLTDPGQVFREFQRVLKPGGVLLLQTPNRYDYVSIIASFTPYRFNRWLMSRILDRREEDVFPVLYRANSRGAMRRALRRTGLVPERITLFNQYPAYLMFSTWTFRLGILYERLTSRYEALAPLRGWLLAEARKPLPQATPGPAPRPGPTASAR
jgi:SAM-dependent methyltransferase